jgi:hypothetical protein
MIAGVSKESIARLRRIKLSETDAARIIGMQSAKKRTPRRKTAFASSSRFDDDHEEG